MTSPLTYVSIGIFWAAALIAIVVTLAKPKPPRALLVMTVMLTELAIFVTIYGVLFWNTDSGYPLFSAEQARIIGRNAPVIFVAAPVTWIVAFVLNWFRDPEEVREAGRRLSR